MITCPKCGAIGDYERHYSDAMYGKDYTTASGAFVIHTEPGGIDRKGGRYSAYSEVQCSKCKASIASA